MPILDELAIALSIDLSAFKEDIESARAEAVDFGGVLSRAFDDAVVRGERLSDVLRNVALSLSNNALDASLGPIETLLSAGVGKAVGGFGALVGDVFKTIVPLARGGVVGEPTLFPLGPQRMALAGEAGPEAVLPLTRGADGRLGVAAQGAGGATNITLNITTSDAASFQRSQPQIEAMLARAVSRGQRNL